MIDVYAVLGVSPDASQAELKAAHRALVRRHHPDLAPPGQRAEATQRVQQINVAYGLVRIPAARARYDRARRFGAVTRVQWEELLTDASSWAGRWWGRRRARARRMSES